MNGGKKEGRPHRRPSYWTPRTLLNEVDHSEVPVRVARAGRKEQLVRLPVQGRSAAELEAPQSVNCDRLPCRVLDRAHQFSRSQVVSVDVPGRRVVRNQQRAAQSSKRLRSHRHPPRLVQRLALRKALHERSIFPENVDVSPCAPDVLAYVTYTWPAIS